MNQNRLNISPTFLIGNTAELSAAYRLFKITGLQPDAPTFQQDRQILIKKLSQKLKHPVTVIVRESAAFLVTRNDADIIGKVPTEFPRRGGNHLYLQDTEQVEQLDFTSTDENTRVICQRFLQFSLQGQLTKQPKLWQPKAGHPFFLKEANKQNGVATFTGFVARVMDLGKDWGICVDVTKKYTSARPLPAYLTKAQFDRDFRGKIVFYPFGDRWYELRLDEWSDLTATQYVYDDPVLQRRVSLHEAVRERTPPPHTSMLANLPEDASVLIYYTANKEPRAVPACLCFEVFSTSDSAAGAIHRQSILPPHIRLRESVQCVQEFLRGLRFGQKTLNIHQDPLRLTLPKFDFPNFMLGDSVELRLRDFHFKPGLLAKTRMEKLTDGTTGFLKPEQTALGPQYLFLPRSIFDTVGLRFKRDLQEQVQKMYPWDTYDPQFEWYENNPSYRASYSYVEVGTRIVEAVRAKVRETFSAYAVVMIPNDGKTLRKHDKLAAMVTRELYKSNIHVSIIHASTISTCFQEQRTQDGKTQYRLKEDAGGKYRGYIQNVALTKVLLLNNKFPFRLNTPLAADLTIGIDVKNNLAGFVMVDKYCHYIRTEMIKCKQPEKLTQESVRQTIYDQVKKEWTFGGQQPLKVVVIHRDGRIFDTEEQGITDAVKRLKKEGCLTPNAIVTILEIAKTSMIPVRLIQARFNRSRNREEYDNPAIGTWYIPDAQTGYLCTTGAEFRSQGTSKPLCIRLISGDLPFEAALRDVFYLSTLAFTKPDYCSRLPITTKLLDNRLRDQASEYDEDENQNLEWEDGANELDDIIQQELSQI